MKKYFMAALVLLIAVSPLSACSITTNPGGGAPPDNQADVSSAPNAVLESAADFAMGNSTTEAIIADDWMGKYIWHLEAIINQREDFGALQGKPGAYADYEFHIRARGTDDTISSGNQDPIEGEYRFGVEAFITIDTDEFVDHLLSEILGEEVSGMGLGADAELIGSFISDLPYYIGDDGNPKLCPFDLDTGYCIWPDGSKQDFSQNTVMYASRIGKNWQSPIRDKNGQVVQAPEGNYLMYDTFKMEFTGSTSHLLAGTFAEDVMYDVEIYAVIEPGTADMDLGDYDANVYVKLTTSEHHSIWLEGNGKLTLNKEKRFDPYGD